MGVRFSIQFVQEIRLAETGTSLVETRDSSQN